MSLIKNNIKESNISRDIEDIDEKIKKNDELPSKNFIKELDIEGLDIKLNQEIKENYELISEIELFKSILKKKDYEFMTMSDKEKMNAQMMKGNISL